MNTLLWLNSFTAKLVLLKTSLFILPRTCQTIKSLWSDKLGPELPRHRLLSELGNLAGVSVFQITSSSNFHFGPSCSSLVKGEWTSLQRSISNFKSTFCLAHQVKVKSLRLRFVGFLKMVVLLFILLSQALNWVPLIFKELSHQYFTPWPLLPLNSSLLPKDLSFWSLENCYNKYGKEEFKHCRKRNIRDSISES